MRIRNIALDDDGDPSKVLFEMSIIEAVYLTKLIGDQNGLDAERTLPGHGQAVNSEIYGSLTGELFNRFYDDGVDDAVRLL
jgi:hypothetical protein